MYLAGGPVVMIGMEAPLAAAVPVVMPTLLAENTTKLHIVKCLGNLSINIGCLLRM